MDNKKHLLALTDKNLLNMCSEKSQENKE